MHLNEAERVAEAVMDRLAAACERIEVAGSIRRREPEVKNVEIVYESKLAESPQMIIDVGSLLRENIAYSASYPMTDDVIRDLVTEDFLRYDEVIRRNGPKYKRMIHVASGAVVELFRATAVNWGVILVLRTGPAAFNKMLVAHGWDGGVLPPDYKIRDGHLWYRGQVYETPEERDFFDALGVPTWRPEERHAGRLRLFEQSRARVARFE